MNYLEELKGPSINQITNLQNKRRKFLDSFRELNLESNLLDQINDDLINYFKELLPNLDMMEDEIVIIKKMFRYYETIKSLDIDLSNLYLEDKNLLNFKEGIKKIYQKSIEYKNLVVSNLDLEITREEDSLNKLNNLKELLTKDTIDLDEVHDLIDSLSIESSVKFKIYKEFYLKEINNLRKQEANEEENIDEILSDILTKTKDNQEVEEKIEEEGTRFEITDEDKVLQINIQRLYDNILKLKDKLPIDSDISNMVGDEKTAIIEDKIAYANLLRSIESIIEELQKYLVDKDTVWGLDYSESEVEEYLRDLYQDLLNKYSEYSNSYQELYKKYGRVIVESDNDFEVLEEVSELPPIIFFVDGIDRFMQSNDDVIPSDLEEVLRKNYKYINKIKESLETLKQRDFTRLKIDKIDAQKPEFHEIKVTSNTKNDLAIRIYYDFYRDSQNNSYPVVFSIIAKDDFKPTREYNHISNVISSRYFKEFMKDLPDETKLEKIKKLEQLVYEKIVEIEEQYKNQDDSLEQESIGGSTK